MPEEFAFQDGAAHEVFTFDDGDHVKGTVAIEADRGGLWIFIEGFREPLALVDLYHLADEDSEHDPVAAGAPQIVLYDGDGGDPVARAHFRPTGTRIDFADSDALNLNGKHDWEAVYGRPERKKEE